MCRTRCDQSDYTFKKAVSWGICSSHFKAKGKSCFGRVVHFGLGILLLPPVVGQIIALLELGIIKLFTRPLQKESLKGPFKDPISVRPVFSVQERITDSIYCWPTNLGLLNLTEKEKSFLDCHLKNALAGPKFDWSKRRLQYGDSIDIKLPIGIAIHKVDNANHVWLFPKASKSKFMSGGERTIGWAYNLTLGKFSLKKRILGKHEEFIIRTLVEARKKRGIEGDQLIWREDKVKKKKQVIEPILDGIPVILFDTAPFASISLKRKLILDFFSDLLVLHQMEFDCSRGKYFGFHHDLKLGNLLVGKDKNGNWYGEVCDFGQAASNPDSWCISVGYTPPEVIKFFNERCPKGFNFLTQYIKSQELIEFNIQFGQKRDIWSMGLIMLSILSEETTLARVAPKKTVDIAPLECLKMCIKPLNRSYRYEELGILDLTQKCLDQEVSELQKKVEAKHPNDIPMVQKLFVTTRSMLRIDPNERPGVKALLKLL